MKLPILLMRNLLGMSIASQALGGTAVRLPRMTMQKLMVCIGGIALVFGVAVQIRRVQNRWKCERVIVAYYQMETQWLQWAERAQAKAAEFSEMEDYLRELVRKGEMPAEAGQRRGQARRDQRQFWEAERDSCMREARWCAARVNFLRTETASGTLFDFATEQGINHEHDKASELAIKRRVSSP